MTGTDFSVSQTRNRIRQRSRNRQEPGWKHSEPRTRSFQWLHADRKRNGDLDEASDGRRLPPAGILTPEFCVFLENRSLYANLAVTVPGPRKPPDQKIAYNAAITPPPGSKTGADEADGPDSAGPLHIDIGLAGMLSGPAREIGMMFERQMSRHSSLRFVSALDRLW
jgi:hypothetical protein